MTGILRVTHLHLKSQDLLNPPQWQSSNIKIYLPQHKPVKYGENPHRHPNIRKQIVIFLSPLKIKENGRYF